MERYRSVFDDITELIRRSGREILLPIFENKQKLGLTYKADDVLGQKFRAENENPLTFADSRCHTAIVTGLKDLFPRLKEYPHLKNLQIKLIGEEDDLTPEQRIAAFEEFDGEGIIAVQDPVDGTANFARGALKVRSKEKLTDVDREFSILLAVVINGIVTAGWMYAPCQDLMFTAHVGQGVFLNGKRIRLEKPPHDPKWWKGGMSELHVANYFDAITEKIYFNGAGQRVPFAEIEKRAASFGEIVNIKDCFSWAYIKMLTGQLHFAVMPGLKPWDHLAPALILKEAGGYAARFDGVPYMDEKGEIALVQNGEGIDHIPYRGGIIIAHDKGMWDTINLRLNVPYTRAHL